MNPWHDVHYGDKAPEIVKAIIEIPKGSKGKYEIDKESGLIKLDRALFSAVHYPANYGFIPKTYADDKDPLDILVITSLELSTFMSRRSESNRCYAHGGSRRDG